MGCKYTMQELEEKLEKHKHWLNRDCEGWEDMRLDLQQEDLSGINLENANLTKANLNGVNLSYANLQGAILDGSNIIGTFIRTDFSYAHLSHANLWGDFKDANLKFADLFETRIRGTNFQSANVRKVKKI